MNFIVRYLYNEKLKELNERLEEFQKKNGEVNQTNKLAGTKNGAPLYLVHNPLLEAGQICAGCIYVITAKEFNKSLNYMIVEDEFKYIKIGDMRHDIVNQGIGTQLLKYLDEIAVENGINKIMAWLPPQDLDSHRERLFHFYKKNDYQIVQKKIPRLNVEGIYATKHL